MMLATDAAFEKIYNPTVLASLKKKFGPFLSHHADLPASTQVMMRLMEKMEKKSRRGEVVMVIPDKKRRIWLHTKTFYPAGVYRLLTGGLEPGEAPDKAFRRETREETGFEVKIDHCLAVVTYNFYGRTVTRPFVSYIFQSEPINEKPEPIDSGEPISDFKAVPKAELLLVAQQLRALKGDFADWGAFRAITHELLGRLSSPHA